MLRRILLATACAALLVAPVADGSTSTAVAAAQIALRAEGFYVGQVDGVEGPLTKAAVLRFQSVRGLPADGRIGTRTRRALGALGRPLLGQRELLIGHVGWDVSALEFALRGYGLAPAAVDGRFDEQTAAALRRFQRATGLPADGIAGLRTFRAITPRLKAAAKPAAGYHRVKPGESFFSIAQRYHLSPWRLARMNGYRLTGVLVPGARLRLPAGTKASPLSPGRDAVRAAITRWAEEYHVDPKLARALAWMESGFQQDVVSSVGAVGVMQLLPETWDWVDVILIGESTPRTAEGNVRAGVRYLRWQLDEFDGNVKLALAGWYQGARAVRERGLFDDTKEFVSIVRALYGKV